MKALIESYEQVFKEDGLGRVADRLAILKAFLSIEGHVTARELAERLRREEVQLDDAYVASVLALFCRYGLANERQFQGRDEAYEHRHLDEHHDHLICVRCGAIQEFTDQEIEQQQRTAAHRYGFRSLRHRTEIYGLCAKCAAPSEQAFPLAMASAGERGVVTAIRGSAGMERRLVSMGIRPGAEIVVLNSGRPGPFLVAVQGTRVALGHGMAHRIMVAPQEDL